MLETVLPSVLFNSTGFLTVLAGNGPQVNFGSDSALSSKFENERCRKTQIIVVVSRHQGGSFYEKEDSGD
jgi:hypothetical protein